MNRQIARFGLCLALLAGPVLAGGAALAARCTGADNCRACKNCRYCQHCAKDGGTCGACKRARARRGSRRLAAVRKVAPDRGRAAR